MDFRYTNQHLLTEAAHRARKSKNLCHGHFGRLQNQRKNQQCHLKCHFKKKQKFMF